MLHTSSPISTIESFITRWEHSAASERSNYVSFLKELCEVLGVPQPDPATGNPEHDRYVFEYPIYFANGGEKGSTGFIDLYKHGTFVLEAKQGSNAPAPPSEIFPNTVKKNRRRGTAVRGTGGWDTAMTAAKGQAEQYVRALPATEGNPPFIVVIDVGHTIELHSDFSRAGKTYLPFPDARSYRIRMEDLARPEIRDRLRALWLDPMSLDPSRRSARVTRDVAARLAALATSLERSGHEPQTVAAFLMRCIFTMFAEDVRMIPERTFTDLLSDMREDLEHLPAMLSSLWSSMNTGGFSPIFRRNILRFNGGLFADSQALPLTREQLDLLIDAGRADWHDVEPSIFGTLLERALDPVERHRLGAHYTPRAYVERLVMPTVVEPLREEWNAVQAAALTHIGRADGRADAVKELKEFHRKLCSTRVLDPACGTGNFLYVTMEHMKRLEGEVLDMLKSLGQMTDTLDLTELTVDPHQFLGIEINPRAAAIADLVLWIGYLQWHFRTHGDTMPREPVLRNYHNIECRDAVLAYDRAEPLLDAEGQPVTRWDGRTTKKHPVTGKDVPDESARTPVMRYVNPRKAEWPEAEYIVGNPPFIGDKRMNETLGIGYVDALREIYTNVPRSADYVMYWWHRSADEAKNKGTIRFGLITTNSICQSLNRKVLENHLFELPPISIVLAIPDHPWVDTQEGAAVRIAMTVAQVGTHMGRVQLILTEREESGDGLNLVEYHGRVGPNLTVGADVTRISPLRSNLGLCSNGVGIYGRGFILSLSEAKDLGLNSKSGQKRHIRPLLNGRDIIDGYRGKYVIDLFGLSEQMVRDTYPNIYQWVFNHVRSERLQNNRAVYRQKWWIFGEPRKTFRPALEGLSQFIGTPRTAKHRVFIFITSDAIVETEIVAIASETPLHLGVLSSRIHVIWALAAGGRLGVGNDPRYNKSLCFDPFPFPTPTEEQKARIRNLGEGLDAHRKRQQELHPGLTITDMYNVLEKLRASEALTEKDRKIHEQGLVSLLKNIHDDLDAAVFSAYGWPVSLTNEEILERLVALNAERAREEESGLVRWLRPEFQSPKRSAGTAQRMTELDAEPEPKDTPKKPAKGKKTATEKRPWPATLREQAQAVRSALAERSAPAEAADLARLFDKARKDRVAELLDTLADLGQVREVEDVFFAA